MSIHAVYRKRLEKLLAVVKSVPIRLVNLGSVGIHADIETIKHGPYFTTQTEIECGSVGCILGWAQTIPAARRWVEKNKESQIADWQGYAEYFGVDESFFNARGFRRGSPYEPFSEDNSNLSDRACALKRIRIAIKAMS